VGQANNPYFKYRIPDSLASIQAGFVKRSVAFEVLKE
jgi:hypothetical protein